MKRDEVMKRFFVNRIGSGCETLVKLAFDLLLNNFQTRQTDGRQKFGSLVNIFAKKDELELSFCYNLLKNRAGVLATIIACEESTKIENFIGKVKDSQFSK